jgi:hypothetical protein
LTDAPPPGAADAASPGFSFKRLLPSLIWDVAAPIVTFNALTAAGVPTLYALVAGGVFPLGSIVRGWRKTGQIEPLGIIVVTFLAIGTAASLISGSVFFALVKDSMLTATFGLLCLGSLAFGRPLTFVLIRQMVAGHDAAENIRWNALYDDVPMFRRAQRLIAVVWGIAYIVEAGARVALAFVVAPAVVVNVSPFIAFGVSIALALWTRAVMLATRARRLAEASLPGSAQT